ncbi:MAG: extracellular solute-binding protein [Candidatus Omnitrophica bacterium]|nr:extracellular solute-binding protein [Candidatus Omnitrophota bacterium]
MKKILALILVSCLLISGCGKKADDAGSGKTPEIMMWLIGSEGQAITIKSLAEDFLKKTGIKVNCEAISWGDAHSKYLTSIAGGVAPDIGTMGLTWGTEFGILDSMVDLAAAYPEEVRAIKETIFPGLWNSIEYKGKVYGVPFDLTEYILYYRSDIVKEPPRTWEELEAVLADLNKSNKGMIFDWGSLSWIGYSPFLWQAGGDYYSPDYSKVMIDSPEAERAMRFFSELYTKYNVPKTKIPLEQGMRTGDFPLAISGNWKIDDLRLSAPEIAGKWSIAMLPQGPSGKRTALIGGRIMGIFEQSKHKKEAWAFIRYLSTPEMQKALYEAALIKQDTYFPPNKKTWAMIDMDPKFKKVLVDQAEDSKGPPAIANWDAYTRYIDNVIQRSVLQGVDPKAGLSDVKRELERAASKR